MASSTSYGLLAVNGFFQLKKLNSIQMNKLSFKVV